MTTDCESGTEINL